MKISKIKGTLEDHGKMNVRLYQPFWNYPSFHIELSLSLHTSLNNQEVHGKKLQDIKYSHEDYSVVLKYLFSNTT